jgi:TRAP-type C4-dicarboxylate transport system permease small subunit
MSSDLSGNPGNVVRNSGGQAANGHVRVPFVFRNRKVAMTVKKFLGEFEVYVGAVISGAMFVVLGMQVVSRYVFNSSFSWSEELALILFVWSIYFGAVAAVKRHQHLRLEIFVAKLKPNIRLVFDLIANFFFAAFSCIVIVGVMPIVQRLMRSGTSTAVMGIPKWINYSILPAMFALMLFRLIQDSIERIKIYNTSKKAGTSEKQAT